MHIHICIFMCTYMMCKYICTYIMYIHTYICRYVGKVLSQRGLNWGVVLFVILWFQFMNCFLYSMLSFPCKSVCLSIRLSQLRSWWHSAQLHMQPFVSWRHRSLHFIKQFILLFDAALSFINFTMSFHGLISIHNFSMCFYVSLSWPSSITPYHAYHSWFYWMNMSH